MIRRFFTFLLLFLTFSAIGQKGDSWATLGMVTFDTKFDPDWGIDIQIPTFGPIISALEGKEIEVEGFIIPLTGKISQSHFMLSKYPQSMCFFCGLAGPETAMQVFTAGQKKVAFQEEKIKVSGILRINDKDLSTPLYTLEDAVIVE